MTVEIVRLGDLVDSARTGFASGGTPAQGVFQIRMNNITSDCGLNLSKKRRVDPQTKSLANFLLDEGDVLFNATNSPELVGKSAFFPGLSEPTVFSNHFICLRPDPSQLDGRYLAHWLRMQFQRGRFLTMCRRWVNQAAVGREALLALTLPLPPLEEQRRIAEVLDRADALRAKRRAALAQLDELTQSIFLDMFWSRKRGEWNWPLLPVSEAGRVQLGRQRAPKYQTGKFPAKYVRVANVYEDRLDLSDILTMDFDPEDFNKYRLEHSDILLNEGQSTELVGRPAMWRNEIDDCCFQNTLIRFQSNRTKVLPEFALAVFIRYFRAGDFARVSSKTSNVAHLGAGRLSVMPMPIPPLDLQQEFVENSMAVSHEQRLVGCSSAVLDALFASLQHRAFRGEL